MCRCEVCFLHFTPEVSSMDVLGFLLSGPGQVGSPLKIDVRLAVPSPSLIFGDLKKLFGHRS